MAILVNIYPFLELENSINILLGMLSILKFDLPSATRRMSLKSPFLVMVAILRIWCTFANNFMHAIWYLTYIYFFRGFVREMGERGGLHSFLHLLSLKCIHIQQIYLYSNSFFPHIPNVNQNTFCPKNRRLLFLSLIIPIHS